MIRALLRAILERLLILTALVAVSLMLPFATIWLVRDPLGAQICFWCGPWVVAFWSVILYVLISSRFWRGSESVLAWRVRHGGYLLSSAKSTCWMFAALFLSYGAEFTLLWFTHSPGLMAVGTYVPVGWTILWSATRG